MNTGKRLEELADIPQDTIAYIAATAHSWGLNQGYGTLEQMKPLLDLAESAARNAQKKDLQVVEFDLDYMVAQLRMNKAGVNPFCEADRVRSLRQKATALHLRSDAPLHNNVLTHLELMQAYYEITTVVQQEFIPLLHYTMKPATQNRISVRFFALDYIQHICAKRKGEKITLSPKDFPTHEMFIQSPDIGEGQIHTTTDTLREGAVKLLVDDYGCNYSELPSIATPRNPVLMYSVVAARAFMD